MSQDIITTVSGNSYHKFLFFNEKRLQLTKNAYKVLNIKNSKVCKEELVFNMSSRTQLRCYNICGQNK